MSMPSRTLPKTTCHDKRLDKDIITSGKELACRPSSQLVMTVQMNLGEKVRIVVQLNENNTDKLRA